MSHVTDTWKAGSIWHQPWSGSRTLQIALNQPSCKATVSQHATTILKRPSTFASSASCEDNSWRSCETSAHDENCKGTSQTSPPHRHNSSRCILRSRPFEERGSSLWLELYFGRLSCHSLWLTRIFERQNVTLPSWPQKYTNLGTGLEVWRIGPFPMTWVFHATLHSFCLVGLASCLAKQPKLRWPRAPLDQCNCQSWTRIASCSSKERLLSLLFQTELQAWEHSDGAQHVQRRVQCVQSNHKAVHEFVKLHGLKSWYQCTPWASMASIHVPKWSKSLGVAFYNGKTTNSRDHPLSLSVSAMQDSYSTFWIQKAFAVPTTVHSNQNVSSSHVPFRSITRKALKSRLQCFFLVFGSKVNNQ